MLECILPKLYKRILHLRRRRKTSDGKQQMRCWLHRCTALDAAAAAAACGAAGIAGFAVDCCGDQLHCAHAARKNGGRGAGVKVGTSAPEMVCCTFAQMCCIGADTSANDVKGVVIGAPGSTALVLTAAPARSFANEPWTTPAPAPIAETRTTCEHSS